MQPLPSNLFEGKACRVCGETARYRTKKPGGRCVKCCKASEQLRTQKKKARAKNSGTKIIEGAPCKVCAGISRYAYSGRCVPCQKKTGKQSAQKHKEKYKERYRGRYPVWSKLKSVLGITPEIHKFLEISQDSKCLICGEGPKFPRARLCIDHDHATGYFRGLLCGHCNTALGLFRDNPDTMRKAAEYIENNRWSL